MKTQDPVISQKLKCLHDSDVQLYIDYHIILKIFFLFLHFTDPENQDGTCSIKRYTKMITIKKETKEDFGLGVQNYKADRFVHTSSATRYTDSRSKPISVIRSGNKSHTDHFKI